jgi:hypothetical protein
LAHPLVLTLASQSLRSIVSGLILAFSEGAFPGYDEVNMCYLTLVLHVVQDEAIHWLSILIFIALTNHIRCTRIYRNEKRKYQKW